VTRNLKVAACSTKQPKTPKLFSLPTVSFPWAPASTWLELFFVRPVPPLAFVNRTVCVCHGAKTFTTAVEVLTFIDAPAALRHAKESVSVFQATAIFAPVFGAIRVCHVSLPLSFASRESALITLPVLHQHGQAVALRIPVEATYINALWAKERKTLFLQSDIQCLHTRKPLQEFLHAEMRRETKC